MWWILVPLQSRASWQMPHPPVSSYGTPPHCKQRMIALQKHLHHGGSTVPCEGGKVSVSLCRSLCSTGNLINISYSNFCITSVLSVQHTLQPLTRVKRTFYMQHPAWKLPRDLACFLALAWAGCVCVTTAAAIILEICKSQQTLSWQSLRKLTPDFSV